MPRSKLSQVRSYAYQPIDDYGMIGDLHTAALIGKNGSIDWCCLPHFDSPSLFGAILDKDKGGRWQIAATHQAERRQMYFPDTNVLITRFLDDEGVGEVVDWMPVAEDATSASVLKTHTIIRRVRAVRGRMTFRMLCQPAFNYGRDKHSVHLTNGGAILASRALTVGLASSVPLSRSDGSVAAEFTLEAGEEAAFLLRQEDGVDSAELARKPSPEETRAETTILRWKRWLDQSRYRGRWRETVNRSALALKLMTFAPTGAIVAAPTCSLPETLGGSLNWDYRFTWIRDASFTVYALLRLGFQAEAHRFMEWMEARLRETGKRGKLQIMYGLRGEHRLEEAVLGHWEGYRGSGPVRIGNAAYDQLQLDIYGEMMDSVYVYDRDARPVSTELWENLLRILDWMLKHWRDPDEGIWEARTKRVQNTHSKLMCWVALDRALRMAEARGLPMNRALWERNRDAIFNSIRRKGWNPRRKSFTRAYGSKSLDASTLLMPMVNFISPNDPLMTSTLDAIREELVSDSLVYRYQMAPHEAAEGTFSICTFWLAEALTLAGRNEEARFVFEKMLSYGNHVGLFAEEIGSKGEALGNFPQAFTHLGLINSAYVLDRALDGGRVA